jgi:hypothetical protein
MVCPQATDSVMRKNTIIAKACHIVGLMLINLIPPSSFTGVYKL